MIQQNVLDAQAALTKSVAALSTKIDAFLATAAGSATPAEQATLAQGITDAASAVDALTAKVPA